MGGPGHIVRETRKMRNVEAGNRKVALVIDDMVSFDPFIVRSIRIYGEADYPMERDGLVGAGLYMPVRPARVLELEHGRRTSGRHLVRGTQDRSFLTACGDSGGGGRNDTKPVDQI